MSLKKEYNEKNKLCKVTFGLPKGIIDSASHVCIAGEFNNWNIESLPMKKLKSGEFTISVNLNKGKEYQFKYVIDGHDWRNEIEADRHVPNEYMSENSVVVIE